MTIRTGRLLVKLKWILISLSTFMNIAKGFAAAYRVPYYMDLTRSGHPKVCQTQACRDADVPKRSEVYREELTSTKSYDKCTAQSILQNMDPSVPPCENFYRFACGNFSRNAVIADDRPMAAHYMDLRDRVQMQLRDSIENQITDDDPKSFKLLSQIYRTCLNEEQAEKYGEKDFLEIVENLGGWPVLMGKQWEESKFDWKETMYKFRDIGYPFNFFFSIGITKDMKDSVKRRIHLDQPTFSVSQEHMSQGFNQGIIKSYFQYMIKFAESFGADPEEAKLELKEALEFEIELAKISLPATARRNTTRLYNPTKVSQLKRLYPGVPWRSYLNRLLGPQVRLYNSDVVIVGAPTFFEKLGDVLSRASPRTLANYAFWRLSQESASQLGERVRRMQRGFSAALTGQNARNPRWRECVKYANERANLAAGALYVRRHFDTLSKSETLEIVENVRKSFRGMLEKVTWMDESTRDAALEKLDKMVSLTAYPDELLDDKKLDDYYKNLQVHPDSFIKTTLSLNRFQLAHELERFNKPVIKADWTNYGGSAVVNAFYKPAGNTIQLPAGILQGFYFNKDHPQYMNYAGIGMFIGHEMTHGFDDKGRRFDKNGNLHDWWEVDIKKEFLNRAQCIVNQYGNYTVKEVGLNLDGVRTQGENIADNGGLKEAYLAYESVERDRGIEPVLPGLEAYTPRQLFWLANANVWCAKYRPQYLRYLITVDPHTTNEFRVLGPTSNMPEFARDFECPLGAPMNPAEKCTFW